MVSQRLRSISSVLGGKNSKEIAAPFRARCPSCPATCPGSAELVSWGMVALARVFSVKYAKISQAGPAQQPIGYGKLPTIGITWLYRSNNLKTVGSLVNKIPLYIK